MKLRPSVVLLVRDVARVADFYRELAELQVLSSDDDHQVLGIDGFELVIHKLFGEPEPTQDESDQVQEREDSYSKLCLPVASIAKARTLAKRLGGGVKPKGTEWYARGFRACDGHDPEGNVIQVRQAEE